MKKLSALVLSLMLILFTGCFAAPATTEKPETEKPEVVEESEELTPLNVKWQRTANYANGELVNTVSSITTLTDQGTYTSVGTCSVTGTYGFDMIEEQEILIMVVGSTDCQGISSGYTTTWNYDISDDGMSLTLTTIANGVTVKETFIRL